MAKKRQRKGEAPAQARMERRRYDAASRSKRMKSWIVSELDANAAINDPGLIRARAQDLYRNNAWARKGITTIVNGAVGEGIRAQFKARSGRRAAEFQGKWVRWAESTACDAAGLQDIYGLQATTLAAVGTAGECLIRLRPRPKQEVPIALEVLEADYLASATMGDAIQTLDNGNQIYRGIEKNPEGERVAYHLYKEHPGSANGMSMDTVRVPASQIIHVFRIDRPGQDRGVTWLAPVTVDLRELDIAEDAWLKLAQVSHLFAGFVSRKGEDRDLTQDLVDLPELLPGTIAELPEDATVTFTQPPTLTDFVTIMKAKLRKIAAGLGVSYEAMTGDMSEINFSSGRMGAQEMGRNLDAWIWRMLVPQMLNRITEWFLDACTLRGVSRGDTGYTWTPPPRQLTDPARELPPIRDSIRAGLMSWSEGVRQRGYDPDEVAKEIAADNARFDELEIVVDTDPRHNLVKQVEQKTDQPAEPAKPKKGAK